MERPKLLIATDNFEPRWDGITRFLYEILPSLAEKYKITVIAPDFPGSKKRIQDITVRRIPVFPFQVGDFSPAKPIMSTWKTIQKEVRMANIVWTQTIGPIGAITLRTASRYRKPLVSFVHSMEWDLVQMAMSRHNFLRRPARFITKLIARSLYNKCDTIMVPSLEVLERLEVHGIRQPKVVVPLGTDIDKFRPPLNKGQAKKDIGIEPNKKVVGYCGRIAREKDIRTLLRAFIRLRAKRDDTVLLLVGRGVKDFDSIIEAHKEIIAVGRQEDVVPYLQAMDAYVLPSLLETSSLSTMEAMACGVPPVCTQVGLVRNYVKDRKNGLFFRKGNSHVLSMKLNWLLSNPEIRMRMGIEARKTIVNSRRWISTVQKVGEVLESRRIHIN